MKKLLTLIIAVTFMLNGPGQGLALGPIEGYALRPAATAVSLSITPDSALKASSAGEDVTPRSSPSNIFDSIIELSRTNNRVTKRAIMKYVRIHEARVRESLGILVNKLRVVKKYGKGAKAIYDISFLDMAELKKIQQRLRAHFKVVKAGLQNIEPLKREIDKIRAEYKGKEVEELISQENDEASKEDFRGFAERNPAIREFDEATLRVGAQDKLIVFKDVQEIHVDGYKGQLVRVRVERVSKDLITVKAYEIDKTGRKGKEVFVGSYLYSYVKKTSRRVLSIRNHCRLWLTKGTDTMPVEPLDITIQKRYRAYVFQIENPQKKGHYLQAEILLPVHIIGMPDASLRKTVYARARKVSGKRCLHVYLNKEDKNRKDCVGIYRFKKPNIFEPLYIQRPEGDSLIRYEEEGEPPPGTSNWYREVVKGNILSRKRSIIRKEARTYNRNTAIRLWSDPETVAHRSYAFIGIDFKPGDIVWMNNVPEEPGRVELIQEEGVESLDHPAHYGRKIVRCFYDPDKKGVYAAQKELARRVTSYFADKSAQQPPDPIVVNSRAGGVVDICRINGKLSRVTTKSHQNEDWLFVFDERKDRKRRITVYLLDGLNRPFAKLRVGYYNEKKEVVIYEKPLTITYLDDVEREELAVRMWSLGYAPAPVFVVDFLKYISEEPDRFKATADAERSILHQIAKVVKIRKKITAENVLSLLPPAETLRIQKEKIAALARQTETNPNYKPPKPWKTAEGLEDEELLRRMGIFHLIEDWFHAGKSLNEVLLLCQRALFAETLRFTQGQPYQTNILLHLKRFKERARKYRINPDDPQWVLGGSEEVVGRKIGLPVQGIQIERLIGAVSNLYAQLALKEDQGDQLKARERIGASIWEFNGILKALDIPPAHKAPRRGLREYLEAFKKYDVNPYSYDILRANHYFSANYRGKKAEALAQMLTASISEFEVAKTNLALIRILNILQAETRASLVQYVTPFLLYACIVEDVGRSIKDAVCEYLENVEEVGKFEKAEEAQPPEKAEALRKELMPEARRLSGFMYFAAQEGRDEYLKYAQALIEILEELSFLADALDYKFLAEIEERFKDANQYYEIFFRLRRGAVTEPVRNKREDLIDRLSILKRNVIQNIKRNPQGRAEIGNPSSRVGVSKGHNIHIAIVSAA